jgi:hypothetical protein
VNEADREQLATAVNRRIRDMHRGCESSCPLHGIWVEDIEEIIKLIEEERP